MKFPFMVIVLSIIVNSMTIFANDLVGEVELYDGYVIVFVSDIVSMPTISNDKVDEVSNSVITVNNSVITDAPYVPAEILTEETLSVLSDTTPQFAKASKMATKQVDTMESQHLEAAESSAETENMLVLERREDGEYVLTYYYGSNTSFRLTRTAGGANKVFQPFVSGELSPPTFLSGNAVSWILQDKLTENNPVRMFRVAIL